MTIDDTERTEMHLVLRQVMGDDVARTMMTLLPSNGWSDVARQHDIKDVRAEIAGVRAEVAMLRAEMIVMKGEIEEIKRDIACIDRTMGRLIGAVITFGVGVTVMFVQLNFAIAGLR